ncbi:glycosyltransferase [Haloferax volcanii]|uniref:Glycosyltransferase n=1 Tax=Haloferax volcanii TaxID=2246 RepID=A0A558G9J1_HALVO|nr:glycosyltransferase [Haloferax volcanii]TVT94429.1 glycosyltransferase [Haloferax volcanii]
MKMDTKTNSTPKVSIVIIGKNRSEIREWEERISNQSYENYEICYSTKPGIPQAWNDALGKVSGDIVLFTETDAHPLDNEWLEKIARNYSKNHEGVVHFGEFRGYNPFNFSNTAVSSDLITQYELSESFPIGEDSELFARMDKDGVDFDHDLSAPVYHEPKSSDKLLSRGFQYGKVKARCAHQHGRLGPSKNTENAVVSENEKSKIKFFTDRVGDILVDRIAGALFIVGFVYEYLKIRLQS